MKKKKLLGLTVLGTLILSACGGGEELVWKSRGEDQRPPYAGPVADGFKNFSYYSYEDKAEILYELEKYALDNFLGGIPLYDNGTNVLYSPRLQIPSDVYVPNYGFGVGEGVITEPMTAEQEPVEAWRWYYHSWQSSDPGTLNYWDSQDAVTGDLWALFNSGYYSTEFTDDKTNYQWRTQLAREMPIPLNPDANGRASKWRIPVKTVEDDPNLVYHTLSTTPAVAAFDGKGVQLEDYLTPFKAMLDGNLFRSTDLGSKTSGYVGVAQYKAQPAGAKDWSVLGIQLNEEERAIEFEFNTRHDSFFAMYYNASSLYSPRPQEFIDYLDGLNLEDEDLSGAARYGKKELGVDGILSLGMYTLEHWEDNKVIVFKKNPLYFEKDRASFAGYTYQIVKDSNTAYELYKNRQLDSVGVPTRYVEAEMNNPERRRTLGDTVFKLQVNATNPRRWEELFGVDGAIAPHAEDQYWDVKPVMSNRDFLNGIYYAIDREQLAKSNGRTPAHGFFPSAYMIDPVEGVSFRDTPYGERVLAGRLPKTYGFSKELAGDYFKKAMDDLVEDGAYKRGSSRRPTVITIRNHMQTQQQVDTDAKLIEQYIQDAFNDAVEGFELVVDSYATENWFDPYYDSMMVGQFDLGFGSIGGNVLDPIGFLDTLCSDNRSGFTLSWGPDTSKVDPEPVFYKGEAYAFDALLGAATVGVAIKDGVELQNFTFDSVEAAAQLEADGTVTVTASGTYYNGAPDKIQVDLDYVEFWYYGESGEGFESAEEAKAFLANDPQAWYYKDNGGAITSPIREGENPNGAVAEITFNDDGTWVLVVKGVPASNQKGQEDGTAVYEIDYYFTVIVDGIDSTASGYELFIGPVAA